MVDHAGVQVREGQSRSRVVGKRLSSPLHADACTLLSWLAYACKQASFASQPASLPLSVRRCRLVAGVGAATLGIGSSYITQTTTSEQRQVKLGR